MNPTHRPDPFAARILKLAEVTLPPEDWAGTLKGLGGTKYIHIDDIHVASLPTWAHLELAASVRRLRANGGAAAGYGDLDKLTSTVLSRGTSMDPNFTGTPSCWQAPAADIQLRVHSSTPPRLTEKAVASIILLSDPIDTPNAWGEPDAEERWSDTISRAQQRWQPPATDREAPMVWCHFTPYFEVVDSVDPWPVRRAFGLLDFDTTPPIPYTIHGVSGSMTQRATQVQQFAKDVGALYKWVHLTTSKDDPLTVNEDYAWLR